MKKLIIVCSLLVGLAGVSHAERGRLWKVTIVTGTHQTIIDPARPYGGYLKAIIVSSGATTSLDNFTLAYTTQPTTAAGATAGLFGGSHFSSTAQVTTAIIHKTTSTVSSVADNLSNSWSAGASEDSYIYVDGLIIRSNAESTGEADKKAVIWSN